MTSSDRQLLERAAKAAGMDAHWDAEYDCMVMDYQHKGGTNYEEWNPLTDDGDALRLAVKLRICIEFGYCTDDAPVLWCGQIEDRRDWPMTPNFPDPRASTRRAIVRAAASLGEHK